MAENISYVAKSCSGCGVCEGICPTKAITMRVVDGFARPLVTDACIECGLCEQCCPVLKMTAEGENIEGSQIIDWRQFPYIGYGHSTNKDLRKEAASGALVTEVLKYLLNQSIVDYVITSEIYRPDFHKCDPIGYRIIREADELSEVSGSNYCPVNIGAAIGYIIDNPGRCAIVCLPCTARGLYLAKQRKSVLNDRVKMVISLLCNHVPSYNASKYLFQKYHVGIPKKIKYRGEGWFGKVRFFSDIIGTKPYKVVDFSEYYTTSFAQYFWQESCMVCRDHFGVYADICAGDADFIKEKDSNNQGETILFIKEKSVFRLLLEMKSRQIIAFCCETEASELDRIYGPISVENRAVKNATWNDEKSILRKERVLSVQNNICKMTKSVAEKIMRVLIMIKYTIMTRK